MQIVLSSRAPSQNSCVSYILDVVMLVVVKP